MNMSSLLNGFLNDLNLLFGEPVQLIHDLVDELISLLDILIKLLGALLSFQMIPQVVSHVDRDFSRPLFVFRLTLKMGLD